MKQLKNILIPAFFILGYISANIVEHLIEPKYRKHSYSSHALIDDIRAELDKKNVPYIYEIDQLKREWITPLTKDKNIELYLENVQQSNNKDR